MKSSDTTNSSKMIVFWAFPRFRGLMGKTHPNMDTNNDYPRVDEMELIPFG